MELHIIYTESEIILSKEHFGSWRDIQDQFADYTASLGPWDHEAVIAYLEDDHPELEPSAAVQVAALLGAAALTCVLTF